MQDETIAPESPISYSDHAEPAGALKRALYLWERQPPIAQRSSYSASPDVSDTEMIAPRPLAKDVSEPEELNPPHRPDSDIEDSLKRHASRLASLERVAPGERRLDSPRFSLMMLNAFLGRAVTDGAMLARLPGLLAISDRIDRELADLELEFPAALDQGIAEPDPTPAVLRDEMRQIFAELKTAQKSQQRQLASSLSALHAAISELRTHLPHDTSDRATGRGTDRQSESPQVDDLAQPLIDSERLVDPRPILAAARAAASRAKIEIEDDAKSPQKNMTTDKKASPPLPYRSVLLGSAFLGILMMIFGRDAVHFLSASTLHPALSRP